MFVHTFMHACMHAHVPLSSINDAHVIMIVECGHLHKVFCHMHSEKISSGQVNPKPFYQALWINFCFNKFATNLQTT